VEWGEPIMVKKPKGLSSDLRVTGQWAVVVRRIMNMTGVLKVYLIQTKKYAYRLKFVRAIAPEWVLEALKNISADANIGFETENIAEEEEILGKIADAENEMSNQMDPELSMVEDDEEVQIIGGNERETVVMQSIKSI
jgi:hypothetical protein